MSKIIATISPDTEILEGIAIGRINGSFGTKKEIISLIKKIKEKMHAQVILDLPRCRKKKRTNSYSDDELISLAKKNGVDYLGLSYIRFGKEVEEIKEKVKDTGIRLISKIEAREAEENLTDIISISDGVMIDRGDLAREVGIEHLPRLQRKIIARSNEYGKTVIVATEMLYSMINDQEPTKAEVLDIANAVSAGADYVMLSEETAIGKHPNHVVSMMKKIVDEVSDRYKVIILSAGSGPGLGSLTAEHHVCLTSVGKKTILDLQLESLKRNGVYEEDIIIATGKGHEEIQEKVKGTDIQLAYNPWYKTTNMMTTIWLARHLIENGFIVIYGDIVYEDEIISKVLKNKNDIVLAVEKKNDLDGEDEKICAKDNKLTLHPGYETLSDPKHKCIPVKDAYGEFIGMAKFNRQGSLLLARQMNRLMEEDKVETYLVKAFENLAFEGHDLYLQDISGHLWNDNDTVHDIGKTKKMIPLILEKNKKFNKKKRGEL